MTPETKILAARTALLWDHPFFGTLAIQLQLVDATDDPRIDTMATDGRRLLYDANFVTGLSKDELIFVLAHEVLHNAFEHHVRRQNRKPRLWNVAADFVINGELVQTKVGKMPKGGLLDAGFTGMSAEEVYRILEEEGGGSGMGAGSDPGGCGEILDAAAAHDQAALAEAKAEMQTRVRQAAAIAKGLNAGKLPGGIQRLVDRLTNPVVDWRALLRRFIDENSNTKDFAWARPNRRFLSQRLVMPGMVSDGIAHLVVAIDTSGSIDDKILVAFASEVNGAFGDGMVDKVTVIYADSAVQRVEEFHSGDELDMKPAGGGGTAFSDTFKWVAQNAPDANAVIYFTDLQVYDFGQEPASPVLWAVYGDSRSFDELSGKTPFGEAISLAA